MSKESSKGTGWVLEQMVKQRKKQENYARQKNFFNPKPLLACPGCKGVWETFTKPPYLEIYEDFPTYGLEKEICPRCQNKKKH